MKKLTKLTLSNNVESLSDQEMKLVLGGDNYADNSEGSSICYWLSYTYDSGCTRDSHKAEQLGRALWECDTEFAHKECLYILYQ